MIRRRLIYDFLRACVALADYMIVQITIWVCEACPRKEVVVSGVNPYEDPTVLPPKGEKWGYRDEDGKTIFICPSCLAWGIIGGEVGIPRLGEIVEMLSTGVCLWRLGGSTWSRLSFLEHPCYNIAM